MPDLVPVKFLVVSDIHFGKSASSPTFALPTDPPESHVPNEVPMRDHMIDTVRNADIDAILVPGDLTSGALPSEFQECANVLREMSVQIGVDRANVLHSFGNHDVDWRISRLAEGCDDSPADPLYARIAASVGALLVGNVDGIPGPLPGTGIFEREHFVVFLANSSYFSTHDQPYEHGKLGEEQLRWLRTGLQDSTGINKWRILLLHHHLYNHSFPTLSPDISCLEEGSEALDVIAESGIDLVVHGHRHHPIKTTRMQDGWQHAVTLIGAGSLSVGHVERARGEIPNTMHVVGLDRRLSDGTAAGEVMTYEYTTASGWIEARSPNIGLDASNGFGGYSSTADNRKRVRRAIGKALEQCADQFVPLPPYRDLDLDLQCIRYDHLNALFKEVGESMSLKISGSYPREDVYIKRQA